MRPLLVKAMRKKQLEWLRKQPLYVRNRIMQQFNEGIDKIIKKEKPYKIAVSRSN